MTPSADLGLIPFDLGMRLGKGSGACLALPVIEASARILGRWQPSISRGHRNGLARSEPP
jgi:NaMN:DMB phosphoribosyltransferase